MLQKIIPYIYRVQLRKFFIFAFSTLVLTAFTSKSYAQFRYLVASDKEYFIYEGETFNYIYPAEFRPLISGLENYAKLFKNLYEKEFFWQLDEKPEFVLASSQNQIANGFAAVAPRLFTTFYGGGPELIDEFSVHSWLYVLLSHEVSHLYQTNVKRGYSQTLKNLFGVSLPGGNAFFPPFTYTMHPNIFLPTFFLEGNATMNEMRFGNGGRLYNGAIRALFLNMAKNNKITFRQLMNDHIDFPYGRDKYWLGGFYFLDLAEDVGIKQANRFFYEHADYKANPFQIQAPFRKTFGLGYDEALARMLNRWKPLWQTQKMANEKAIAKSAFHTGLSKNDQEILFLTTPGDILAKINSLDLKTLKINKKTVNLPLGKVFRKNNGELIATGSASVDASHIKAGLFGEGYKIEKYSLDKYYYDTNENASVWADAKTSFYAAQLYLKLKNEKPIRLGATASSAFLGSDNKAYYFKQNAKTRTLYRNSEPIFSYKGYYGVPLEAATDNQIYFIGPTERGSSIFSYQDKKFSRRHSSDLIIDASLIDSSRALIVELNSSGYEYKIVNLEKINEAPFEYTYFVEEEPQKDLLAKLAKVESESHSMTISSDETLIDGKADSVAKNEKPYKTIREMQFDGIDPFIFFGSDTPAVASMNIRFSDPLQNHAVQVLLGSGSYNESNVGLQYINMKNIVNWDVLAQYEKRSTLEESTTSVDDFKIIDNFDAWVAAAGINSVFYKRPLSQIKLGSHFIYQYEDPNLNLINYEDVDQKYSLLTTLDYEYGASAPLAYSYSRYFKFEMAHELRRTAPNWVDPRNIYAGRATASLDIFKKTYLTATFQDSYTDSPYAIVKLDDSPDDTPYPSAVHVERYSNYFNTQYFEVRKASAEILQAFNIGFYFTKFPLALRRFALIGVYNEFYGATAARTEPETLFHEYGGGADVELLLLHRFPLRLRYLNVKSSFDDDTNEIIMAGLRQQF
jgi:hypothetical protein